MSTLAEKLLARAAGLDVVAPGQIVVVDVDVAMAQDGTGPLAIKQTCAGRHSHQGARRCVLHRPRGARRPQRARQRAADHPHLRRATGATLSDVDKGVCHQNIAEEYAYPGDLVIGADSHT